MVYAANQQYPRVNMCVDVAVFKWGPTDSTDYNKLSVVLGQRSADGPLIFPGGHVSPEDDSLEIAARRELSEETGVYCNDTPKYMGSFIIGDPRHIDAKEKIMTAFFTVPFNFGQITASSDLDHAGWYEVNDKLMPQVAKHHQVLLKALIKLLRR
jgi:bifunctional NMN adenylyltransferase/nudix hydrolase